METDKNKTQKSKLQILGSSFIIVTGLFVMLAMTNTITGNVIGETNSGTVISISIALWGLLIVVVGIWMIRKPNFSKSIFDEK